LLARLPHVTHELPKHAFLDPVPLHQQAGNGVVEQLVYACFDRVAMHYVTSESLDQRTPAPRLVDDCRQTEAITTSSIWSRPASPLVTQRTRHIAVAGVANSPENNTF
jgi:hypothetical protein